jgi:Ca-activated chloride channel homolog
LRRTIIYAALACLGIFISPLTGLGNSPAGRVKDGNKAYASAEYDKAVSAYDEALKDAPESPYVYFNKGAALYRKGDYAGAGEAFEKAALKSKDRQFEAKSRFNQGNSAYKEAESLKEKDLQKALDGCSKSIGLYQNALQIEPDLKEAAENIEMVRLVMKNILDEINKQKESSKEEQKKKEETAEKLKELIKEQEDALGKNQKLDEERSKKGDSSKTTKQMADLSSEQKARKDKTEALQKDLNKDNKTNASEEDQVEKHVENAVKEQEAASGNLDQKNTKESVDNQKEAVKDLKDALASLNKDKNNGSGEDNKCQDKKEEGQKDNKQGQNDNQQGQQEQQQDSSSKESQQNGSDQSQQQAAIGNLSDDAKDILNDEKQNMEQRRALAIIKYKDVDKDW